MVLHIIRADILLIARIFPRPFRARKNTTQLAKYPRVLDVKSSNKIYVSFTSVPRSRFLGCHATLHPKERCVTAQKTAARETNPLQVVCCLMLFSDNTNMPIESVIEQTFLYYRVIRILEVEFRAAFVSTRELYILRMSMYYGRYSL